MISFEQGLYVRIEEMEGPRAPMPSPLQSGFTSETAYRVIGIYNPSETSDAYLMLSNERDEIWFISNRHVRTMGFNSCGLLRLPICDFSQEQ